ncbi:LOW QUALITY PROTEIN: hypothetical protein DAPPUDRAFT_239996 [Daphnia pulex]|uniref:Uncharacterized protein n=1 Tax=Daphnia pulex TaxID=6669 RepID=E9GAL8_DAPPU|nr:LOW QUALITY PROTEIN: hypothetical protein DAPPUDRAFT_239996 [Daphnia pulex]|eukprot:EFX83271.1 LOW QUALITY PROTEIN: hypothetical protein DAPPUDRAFT_239996 [Daphnia pulex]
MDLVMEEGEEELTKHKALELELDTYGLINEMGNMAMVSNNHLDSKVITQRQHLLSQGMKNPQKLASHRRQRLVDSGHDEWSKLLETVELRDEKLVAAGEIHRFNRDVAESLSRIQEKYVAIPDDLGRDLDSVLGLIRRHENFETDLVALEAQLQVCIHHNIQSWWMIRPNYKWHTAYPGGNAGHIRAQQALVIESWTTLQERMARRKEELQDSFVFQRFLTTVRDLVTWSSGLVANMSSTEKVHDANEAQALRAEHDRLKGEIEAREDVFSSAVQAGETMIQEEHYSAAEIKDRLIQLLQEREKLHAIWQQCRGRSIWTSYWIFNFSEAALLGTDLGSTAEEVMAQFKKHEAFDKLVQAQDERLALLMEHGEKLIGQNHFESQWIMKRVAEVTAKRLQKHQAFQAEVGAHQGRLNEIKPNQTNGRNTDL